MRGVCRGTGQLSKNLNSPDGAAEVDAGRAFAVMVEDVKDFDARGKALRGPGGVLVNARRVDRDMSSAVAAVAAEIMPGRPPNIAVSTAMQNDA